MSCALRIKTIAANTFLEAVRQKLFNFLLILSIALIASSNFFRQFDFGTSELKFIADFGMGGIFFFGSILAVVASAQLFFSEIENRTALTILAKPVYRWEFIFGKYAGIMGVLFIFTTLMIFLLGVMLFWRETQLMEQNPDAFANGRMVSYGGLMVFGLLQWIKFGIISAITLLIASFSNTNLYTVVVSFFIFIICQLQYIARDNFSEIAFPLLRWLVGVLSLIFPNFQMFNIGDDLLFTSVDPLGAGTLWTVALYGVLYILAFNALAVYSFKNREI